MTDYLSKTLWTDDELKFREEVRAFCDKEIYPIADDIDKGVKQLKSNKCDLVIGIGGGSAIDVAKAVSILADQNKLTKDGYIVNTATNGEEALIQIMKQKPNLILLDVMMPKMNGVETLKRLKAEEKTEMIPVIILTNLGDNPEDVNAAKKLRALDYLVKANITLKHLSERVKKAIETGK